MDKKSLSIKNLKNLESQELKALSFQLLAKIIEEQSMGQVKSPKRKLYKKARARILTIYNSGGKNA